VDRGEFLQGFHLPEPQHGSLSSSEGEMAVLNPVVGPSADRLFVTVTKHVHRSAIRAEAIGSNGLYRVVPLQGFLHEGQSCLFVAGLGDVAFQYLAFLVDGAPKVMQLPANLHVHLVEMPVPVLEASHPGHSLQAATLPDAQTDDRS
jgi:hypothetical protein